MADGYTIKHRDDFEPMEGSGGCTWRLARKSLGAETFGFNVVEIDPGGELPDHDESESGQEEIFVDPRGRGRSSPTARSTRPPREPSPRSSRPTRTIRNGSEAPLRHC